MQRQAVVKLLVSFFLHVIDNDTLILFKLCSFGYVLTGWLLFQWSMLFSDSVISAREFSLKLHF